MILLLTFAGVAERDKFEYIYTKYRNLLLHKAYGILGDYALAEDAAAEAFLRIYKNLHKIDSPDSNQSAAFFATIAKNCALTILERERRNVKEEYNDSLEDSFDLEGHMISRLTSEEIYQAVEQLSEDLRNVFVLKYAYDMSHREIGKSLGISENNVTVRLHRAKKKLAVFLRGEGYDGE